MELESASKQRQRASSSQKKQGSQPSQNANGDTGKAPASSDSIRNAVKDKDDETKYRAAAMMAQNNLSGRDDVDDEVMKDEIDKIYSEMTGGKSGREIRGENLFTDTIGGLNDLINGATLAVGNGLNAAWDWGIGGIADQFGAGDVARNMFDGEDVQGVVDIAADLGLMALGPAGWGAMVAKNAVQNADGLMEALSGKDNVTREDLSLEDRLMRGGQSALGIGLSAVPVVGKAGNVLLKGGGKAAAKDAVKQNAKQVAKEERYFGKGNAKTPEMQGPLPKASALDAIKTVPGDVKGTGKSIADVVSTISKEGTPLTKAGRDAGVLGRRAAREDAVRSMPGVKQNLKAFDVASAKSAGSRAKKLDSLMEKAGNNPVKMQKALEKSFKPGIGERIGGTVGAGALNTAAGVLPPTVSGEEFDPKDVAGFALLSTLMPGLGRKGVGMTGKRSANAQRLGLIGSGAIKNRSRQDERDAGDVMSEDDILRALRLR